MGELAGWVCYERNHSYVDSTSETAARQIHDARPAFSRYCGGEEYISEYDGHMSLDESVVDDENQSYQAKSWY